MTAGVPGLGLSGLFVMLSAAIMPLWRLRRGQTNRVRPVRVHTILGLALVIAAATWLTWEALAFTIGRLAGTQRHVNFGTFAGLPIILASLLMVFVIIGAAELVARVVPANPTPVNPPVRSVRTAPRPEPAAPQAAASDEPIDETQAVSGDGDIEARCRELADQRAQLRTARENAAHACDRLLERLDTERAHVRALTNKVSALDSASSGAERE
jgi:hypothetical protein